MSTYEDFRDASPKNRRLLLIEGFLLRIREELCEAMERLGLSHEEIARRIGRGDDYVNLVLSGRYAMSLSTLVELADAMGLTPFFKLGDHHSDEGAVRKGYRYL